MKKLLLFACAFFAPVIYTRESVELPLSTAEENHLKLVLENVQLREKFAPFLDNVLKIVPSQNFYHLADCVLDSKEHITHEQIYTQLREHINSVKPWIYRIKLLNAQKKVILEQAQELLVEKNSIDGYLEIGTPGTYLSGLADFLSISGKKYVFHEREDFSGRIQAFSFNIFNRCLSYDQFIALDNYAPISEQDIASNSLDLIVCVIGLHHVPREKLADFISSLKRILRPGGLLLLREHDCKTSELKTIASAAHSVYNVIIPHESVLAELSEYRNFQALDYWIDLLRKQGFAAGDKKLLQTGDPTANTLLLFTKKAENESDRMQSILRAIKDKHTDYYRDLTQSYLSTPEWVNVDVAQEYGTFIEHTPFYQFPYMRSVQSYWSSFIGSWQAAARKSSNFHVLTSSYTLMNLFVGITMTIEYIAKSIISAPVRWMYAGAEASTLKALIKDPNDQIEKLNAGAIVIESYPDVQLKLISVPRYKLFLDFVNTLALTDITILEIAGQKEIQFKVRHALSTELNDLPNGCKREYSWNLPTVPGYLYSALTVRVGQIKEICTYLKAKRIEILYVHDY